MQGRITKRSVDSLAAGASGEAVLWDSEVPGFGVRARSGGTKTYVVRYRPGAGGRSAPLRTYTIGRHGSPFTDRKTGATVSLTADIARDEARFILGLVTGGADPAADHSARRAAPSVAELAERFLREHAEAKRKAKTTLEYRKLINRLIVPALGKWKVADVTRQEIAKLHSGLRSTPYQANRVLAVVRKMFNLAEAWGLRPAMSNPCHLVEPFKEHARERMLSADELAALGAALKSFDGNPYAAAAVRLLVFTGARLSEILSLRWEWIDLGRGEARLPDSKTGAKTLHLPPPALAVLADVPRVDGNPFVIVGAKDGAGLVNLQKPWRMIRAAAARELLKAAADRSPEDLEQAKPLAAVLANTRLHDLRHAFASVGAASGLGLPIIGKMLGHTQPNTTARYAHLASDPVKAAAATVAGKIDEAMNPPARSADVVEMRRGLAKTKRPR
jgi:integrase